MSLPYDLMYFTPKVQFSVSLNSSVMKWCVLPRLHVNAGELRQDVVRCSVLKEVKILQREYKGI